MNEELKIQAERQKFQSNGRLFALKVHAVLVKVENVLFWPFRKLADSMTNTYIFREENARPSLSVVK